MKFVTLALCVLVCAASVFGQANATITGTIADPSGAVIANAPIEVRNLANGQIYTTASTETGNFTVPQLPIGQYDMVVTVPGFKTYNRQGFSLSAQQIMRQDITLEVGTAAEAVTVTAEASLLKTESGEIVHNVTVSQMQNLPILTVGGTGFGASSGFRDPFALAQIVPGIQYTANLTMIVNGNPDDTMQIRVEGQVSGNTGGLRQYTGQTQPSVDAVQEVAVQTSNYSAEFGTVGGAVMNVQMKSGTNQYHGSGYDYLTNEAFNSATPYTGVRTATKRNDYGGTIGGPLNIPKLYNGADKTFFFFSYEQFRENLNVRTTQATVPIAPYRAGDFGQVILGSGVNNAPRSLQVGNVNYVDPLGRSYNSGQIFDPSTERTVVCNRTLFPTSNCVNGQNVLVRDAFLNNVIPTIRFDPVAVKVLNLVPLPEGPNHNAGLRGNNYQRPWLSHRTSELPSVKLDHNLSDKGRLSFYWQTTGTTSQYSFPNGNAEGLPEPVTIARGTFIYSKTMRATYTYTITPTMLLTLGAGWNSLSFDDHSPVTNYDAVAGLGLRGAVVNRTFPQFNTAAAQATGGMSQIGTGGQGHSYERRPAGNVGMTWVKGNHSYKFGAEYRLEKYPAYGFTGISGNYSFNGAPTVQNSTIQTALQGLVVSQGTTGFAFASFLLGQVNGVNLATPIASGTSKSQFSVFAQDSWKVTRKLTLDYGLRWDYGTYAKEHYGRNGNLNLNIPNASAGGHPGGLVYEATCNCNFAKNYPLAFGPRVGMAYQINPKTVLRAGFGVVYNSTGLASGSTTNDTNGGTPGFGQWLFNLKDGIPSNVKPVFPAFDSNVGHLLNAVINNPAMLDRNAGRPPRQAQWSVGLQRELTRNLVVEASYVANRGVWWPVNGLSASNEMTPELLGRYGFQVGNTADSSLLRALWSGLNTTQLSTLASKGIAIPYSGFPLNQSVRQSIRPFPQYSGGIGQTQAPLGKTWYDGLQINLTQRSYRGLSLNANYAFAKALNLMGSPDIFNRQLGKNLGNDLPHQFRLSATYDVPRFNGGSLGTKVLSNIASDWGIGWSMTLQSGALINRPATSGTDPINNWLGRGPGSAQLKKDADGNYMSPFAINWTGYDGQVHPEPLDINCRCYDPAKTIVLNPAAWENVPNGQWANEFNSLRFYRNIRQPQENANISRNFRMGRDGHILLHVRGEFQNVFNRTRLSLPGGGSSGFQSNPTSQNGQFTGGFGALAPINGTPGARTGAVVARISF